MVGGGATGTDYSEQFIESIAKYIVEKQGIAKELEGIEGLSTNAAFKEPTVDSVTKLLRSDKSVLDDVVKHFTENKKDLEILLEQANKV
jgi:hypothetical protein